MKTRTTAILISGLIAGVITLGVIGTVRAQPSGPTGHGPGMGGMMGGQAGSMMGDHGGGMRGGQGAMMAGWGTLALPEGRTPTLDEVRQGVEQALARNGLTNLAVTDVRELERGFQVATAERDTGTPAFEVFVSKATGQIMPAHGAAMMGSAAGVSPDERHAPCAGSG